MILPSKYLSQDRALLTIGAKVLQMLTRPKTVSALWDELSRPDTRSTITAPKLSYDWFVLALDLLFIVDAIDLRDGLVARKSE